MADGWAVVVAQVVAHRTTDREVPGSIPTGSWGFFLFSTLSYQKCVLNQVPRGGATLLIFLIKMLSCAAWGDTSIIRTVWVKNGLRLRKLPYLSPRCWKNPALLASVDRSGPFWRRQRPLRRHQERFQLGAAFADDRRQPCLHRCRSSQTSGPSSRPSPRLQSWSSLNPDQRFVQRRWLWGF